jgi:cation diffusion facilitator CzcD-associated flavoprotein CzcO
MQKTKTTAVIIGAGFAGICMGIKLKEIGINDFVIIEGEDGPGGTWRVNTYPGAACDVHSHLYSFSFEPYPKWSRMFGLQEEILKYQENCCEKYGLYPHCIFNTFVTEANYQDNKGTWIVKTSEGQVFESQFVISGSGGLSKPAYPKIKGLEQFKGPKFHSARWDHKVDLKGKRVAVIGSGASAIQIVSAIVNEVAHLDYYQRTPSWVLPKPDRAISKVEQSIFKLIPSAQKLYRGAIYAAMESRAVGFVISPKLLSIAKQLGIRHVKKYIKDPVLQEKMIPTYEMGCKRILMSNEYYQAVARNYVDVVSESIASIDENGIYTNDGQYRPVDVIVYCTGFYASEDILQCEIFGKNNVDIKDAWKDGPEAYLGTTVTGYPNMFTIVGPNTGLGHNSMIYMIESQVHYIMEAIKYMNKEKVQAIDTKPEVQETYNIEIQKRLKKTIWNSGCQSWYMTKSGKNTTLWPGFTFEFRSRTSTFQPKDYELLKMDSVSSRKMETAEVN